MAPRSLILRRIDPHTRKLVQMDVMFTNQEAKALVRWTRGEGTLEELLPNLPAEVKTFLSRTVHTV